MFYVKLLVLYEKMFRKFQINEPQHWLLLILLNSKPITGSPIQVSVETTLPCMQTGHGSIFIFSGGSILHLMRFVSPQPGHMFTQVCSAMPLQGLELLKLRHEVCLQAEHGGHVLVVEQSGQGNSFVFTVEKNLASKFVKVSLLKYMKVLVW